MGDITLSAATRVNILSLQRTQTLIDVTQTRLATGLKVNSALDDALAFFTARNLSSRAGDLATIKDAVNNGISVVRAATLGLEAIESVLKQMDALATSAISATESTTRAELASQFNELRSQVDNLAEDSSFDGINLLKSGTPQFEGGADNLTVTFNERIAEGTVNRLIVSGLNAADYADIVGSAALATGTAGATDVWGQTGTAAITAINAAITELDAALVTVRSAAETFGTNAALLQIRLDFTTSLINTLDSGAAELVNADLNEESASLLSLQTRQQLGTISLSIAQRSEQAMLRLF
ncbi:MAG: flagellin [Rhodospirillaceae bacterium]